MPIANVNRFDPVTLQLFVAAVRSGSLTKGAELANMSVAAASKRIAELEGHLRSSLLTRGKHGVVPTAAGNTLLQHAVGVVAAIEDLSVAMADFHRGVGGHLRLWANTTAFTGFLPGVLARYAALHPAVALDLEDAWSDEVVQAVSKGVAELGIIGEHAGAEGLCFRPCHVDALVLLLPPGHALFQRDSASFDEILEFDMVSLHRKASITRQIAAVAGNRPLRIRAQVRGYDDMCRMVAAGLGLGIIPRCCVSPLAQPAGLRTLELTGMNTERRQLLVARDWQKLSGPAQGFVEMMGAVPSPAGAPPTPAGPCPRRSSS